MTKAELVKCIADLKIYALHGQERIIKAEAKIAELKDEIDDERATYNDADVIKYLTKFVKKQEELIEGEKKCLADNDRTIAELTAELNEIQATGNNAEADVEDYVVTPEAQEVAVQAEIDNAINAEAVDDNAEAAVEVVDVDELIDTPEIQPAQYTAIDTYSPPVEVQTADEVKAKHIEKLQQVKSQIDADIKGNAANLKGVSIAIDAAEIADEPVDELSDIYFDLLDQNKKLECFKNKIENELSTTEIVKVETIDIEDDYYDGLWRKVPEFDNEGDIAEASKSENKINLLTLNAPFDAAERQAIINKGTNNANDNTITVDNLRLAPSDEHMPIKLACQYFSLQAKSSTKTARTTTKTEGNNVAPVDFSSQSPVEFPKLNLKTSVPP